MNNPSEINTSAALDSIAPAHGGASASAGVLLRQARERSGTDLQTLAKSINVPADKLQALEADDWQRLPSTVFVRTVAASVCRELRVDPAPILALLPKSTAPSLERATTQPRQGSAGVSFQASALPTLNEGAVSARRWWALTAALLVVAGLAAAVFWMPQQWRDWMLGQIGDNAPAGLNVTPAPQADTAAVQDNATAAPSTTTLPDAPSSNPAENEPVTSEAAANSDAAPSASNNSAAAAPSPSDAAASPAPVMSDTVQGGSRIITLPHPAASSPAQPTR